jgi:predicted nucleotidyltransferase
MDNIEKGRTPALRGEALRRAIRDTIGQFVDLNCHQVFIFGSEATAACNDRSDIDIGILGPQPISGSVMQRMRDALEHLRTLRTFDLVDFSRVDESFKAVVLQNVERL